jgi:hypothetical protein
MASEFFGSNRGQLDGYDFRLTVGGATGGTDIELRVDTGKGTTVKDVIIFLEQTKRYLMESGAKLGTVGIPPI